MVTELKRLDAETAAPELDRAEVIQVYEDVFAKRRRRVSRTTSSRATPGARGPAIITRYLLEDKLDIAVDGHPAHHPQEALL